LGNVDGSLSDAVCNGGSEDGKRNEVPEGRPRNGQARMKHPRRDNGCDRVGRIMEPINEIESQGHDDEKAGLEAQRQLCFR
jgi:hypothetical protein